MSVEATSAPLVPVVPITPGLPVTPEVERPPAIGSRLRSPGALISLLLPIVLLGLLLKTVAGLNFGALASSIASASPLPLLVGAVVFYGVFPLRGWRWGQLLHGAGIPISSRDAIEILSLSWFINCVVPARLGDVYRAWLLRRTSSGSGVNGLATVVVERGLDLLASAGLAVAAGLWLAQSGTVSVGDGVVSSLTTISAVLFGLCVVIMVVVIKTHAHILPHLPLSLYRVNLIWSISFHLRLRNNQLKL